MLIESIVRRTLGVKRHVVTRVLEEAEGLVVELGRGLELDGVFVGDGGRGDADGVGPRQRAVSFLEPHLHVCPYGANERSVPRPALGVETFRRGYRAQRPYPFHFREAS